MKRIPRIDFPRPRPHPALRPEAGALHRRRVQQRRQRLGRRSPTGSRWSSPTSTTWACPTSGLAILYDIVNQQPDMLAERAYTPWVDMLDAMRREGLPLYSLETRHPLAQFDVLGFSLPYEQLYTNVLTTLDLAGIPLRAADRTDEPLVLAGGSACLNPEPMHAFFDAFFVGEGEEAIVEIARTWTDARRAGLSRHGSARAAGRRSTASTCRRFYEATYNDGRHPRTRTRPDPTLSQSRSSPSASSPSCRRPSRSSSCPSSTSSTTGRPSRFSAAAPAAAASARRA